MKSLNKGLKHYNTIYTNKDNATISELAEAKVYFDSIGGQFKGKSKDLQVCIEKYTKGDLFAQEGVEQEAYVFDADTTYILKEIPKTIQEIDEKAIFALKGKVSPKYFKTITTEVVDKELIFDELKTKVLDPEITKHVRVYEQTSLGFRKKPISKAASAHAKKGLKTA